MMNYIFSKIPVKTCIKIHNLFGICFINDNGKIVFNKE